MGQSNGMGFWRRMKYGMHRESWKSGEIRQAKKRETASIIDEEVVFVRGTKAERIPMSNGLFLHVHNRSLCENDPHCAIHNPSNHSMIDFPQIWREDRGLMERVCPHGVGHPDPDDLAFKRREYGEDYKRYAFGSHGCDGCCYGAYEGDDAA